MSETLVQDEPNVEVEGETSPDIGHGASFDDLDELTTVNTEQELMDNARDFLQNGSEETTAEEEDKSQVPGKDDREASEATKEEIEEEIKEEIKYAKSTFKDISQDVAEDSTFRHTVDGEEVDVSLKDLLNNYSGKINYNQKYKEFSEERKSHEKNVDTYKAELDNVNKYIDGFAEKVKNKDGLGALGYLAEFAGMKPYEFKRELLSQMAPEIDRIRSLTEDQQSNEQLKEEKQFLEDLNSSNETKREQEQAVNALQQEISHFQETYSISDEDFNASYFELKEAEMEGITPAVVAEYCVQKQSIGKADSLISEALPNFESDDAILENVAKIIMTYDKLPDSDIVELIQEVYGSKKNVEKASKSVSAKVGTDNINNKKSQVRALEDYADFDDF